MAAYDQHDAHEFFHAVIHGFEDHLLSFHEKLHSLSNADENKHKKKGYFLCHGDLISDMYSGILKSDLQCLACEHISSKFESFADISLTLDFQGKKSEVSIAECVDNFTKSEVLSETILCRKCQQNNSMQKKMTFAYPPRNLVLHLKRFNALGNEKLNKLVEFSASGFILPCDYFATTDNLCSSLDNCHGKLRYPYSYDLDGVVAHYGTLDQGHYVSYIRMKCQDASFVHKSFNAPHILSKCAEFVDDIAKYDEFTSIESSLDSYRVKSLLNIAVTSICIDGRDQRKEISNKNQIKPERINELDRNNYCWVKYDDNCVSAVSESEVLDSPAYLLFYKKHS